jgi:hypothetical protein
MRREINQHTLEKMCHKQPVRISKVASVLKIVEQYERECTKKQSTNGYQNLLPLLFRIPYKGHHDDHTNQHRVLIVQK